MKKLLATILVCAVLLANMLYYPNISKASPIEYDVFDMKYGFFAETENIKIKDFSAETYEKAKSKLKEAGISDYWSDHVLQQIAGFEDDNIGKRFADELPASFLYGDIVEDIIKEVFNAEEYTYLDLTKTPIEPNNKIKDFKVVYQIPITPSTPFSGDILLTFKPEVESGPRDNINFEIGYTTIDEKYHKVEKEEMLSYNDENYNRDEITYEVVLNDITYGNVKNITLTYTNDFNLPTQPGKMIADGLQKGLNELAFPAKPISDKAHDDIEEMLDEMGLNEFCGNMDYGKIITEQLIERIPYVGKAISLAGLTDNVASVINGIIGEDDVISKAKISDAKLTIKQLSDNDLPFNKNIDFEEYKHGDSALDRWSLFTYENNTKFHSSVARGYYRGNQEGNVFLLYDSYKKAGPKAIMKNSYTTDFEYSADVYIANLDINETGYNDVGFIFRANNLKRGEALLDGYYFSISDSANYAKFGKFENNQSKSIKTAPINIESNKWYKLKVKAVGDKLSFYVDNMLEPKLEVNDSTYKSGYVGIRHFSEDATKYSIWDNFFLSKIDVNNIQSNEQPFEHAAIAYSGTDRVEARADIDGNGKADLITWEAQAYRKAYLRVNNFSYYDYTIYDYINLDAKKFWIIDIDPNDKYKEIVMNTYTRNDSPPRFVILDNLRNPYLLNTVGGAFEKIISFGDGTLTAIKNGERKQYKLNEEHKLVDINEEIKKEEMSLKELAANSILSEGASNWAVTEIQEAYKLNLYTDKVMSNYTKNITRSEFAGLAVKLYEALTGEEATAAGENTFADTKNIDVLKAYQLKIVNGMGEGLFAPDNLVNREQMAVMFYYTIKVAFDKMKKNMPKTDGILTVKDKDKVSVWASKQVDFAFDEGIITGDGVSFNPKGNASREAAIAVIKRVYNKYMGK